MVCPSALRHTSSIHAYSCAACICPICSLIVCWLLIVRYRTEMAPLAYIFIRLLPQSQIGDGEDDELIVSRYSPSFSKVEYDTFINDSNANVATT